jgi:hypothetical protein
MVQILKQGMITSPSDITTLHIIDFKRTNGYWNNDMFRAINIAAKWLTNTTMYTIIDIDLTQFSKRDDWPGWRHTGRHVPVGQLYWDFFQEQFRDDSPELSFSDMPDFTGSFLHGGKRRYVYGDIGEVSVSTFIIDVIPQMEAHDLWVSVLSEHRQVILEPQISFQECVEINWNKIGI